MAQPDRVRSRSLHSLPELSERMKREPTIFVTRDPERYQEIMRQPSLLDGEDSIQLRYNVFTGAIYSSSWQHKRLPFEVTPEDLENQGAVVLGKRGKRHAYDSQTELIWKEYPDIETAIRATEHIMEKHAKSGGPMVENTKYLIGMISRLLPRFRNGPISLEELEEIAAHTANELKEAGFVSATKPVKKAIFEQVNSGLSIDSLGRVNRLISRSRLTSAWIKLIRELLFAKDVREKYQNIHDILVSEREVERFALWQSNSIMNDIMQNFPTDYEGLAKAVTTLRNISLSLLTPDLIKAAPYRKAALLTRYVLFGDSLVHDKEDKIRYREMIKQLFEDEEMFAEASKLRPLDTKTSALNMELPFRLGMALVTLREALSLGEKNLQT